MSGRQSAVEPSGDGRFDTAFKDRVCRRLRSCSLRRLEEACCGEAAVLFPIFRKEGAPHLLLTQRTHEVATHKGQISFPGGVREDADASLRETALRETEEEVGISSDFIEVVGPFHQYMAVTRCCVTPYVAFLREGFLLRPNPQEVDRVLSVPLEFFGQARPRWKVRRRPGKRYRLYFYDYRNYVIWGLTAAMIKDFVALLGARK